MKFFTPLGYRYGKEPDTHSSSPLNIYGPYKDDEEVQQALARIWPNDKETEFLVFDGQLTCVRPNPKEKPEHEKRAPGDPANYIEVEGGGYKCKDCEAAIMAATVAHPIWEPGIAGGSGECHHEQVPYCPNCERKPGFHGAPITAG